jgi:diaminopimelate epimerase
MGRPCAQRIGAGIHRRDGAMSGQKMRFYKMTGAGNDFILIDNRKGTLDADSYREFARRVCRRKLSTGADGLILIENDPEVDFKWRFFNADGSEAEMCGNGARCAARFAHLTGIVSKSAVAFRTIAGIIRAELLGSRVKVQMTAPHGLKLGIQLEAEARSFNLDFINTGVPHVVCNMASRDQLEAADVQTWGHAVRFHPQFQPAGTNVNFIYVQNPSKIIIRTYERGVEGETLACGTGAIASALVCAVRSLVTSPVELKTRSGESLTIHFQQLQHEFSEVFLEGEAKVAYEAELWSETLK